MASSVRKQLTELLAEVLPATPEQAITGTDLLLKVKDKIDGEFSESSLRNYFAEMSRDPSSPIAKVDQGRGYYKRTITDSQNETEQTESVEQTTPNTTTEKISGRINQREEKFRSLFIRWADLNNHFPMHVEHTSAAKQKAGINKWKFPDVVTIKWEVGQVTDDGFRLERDLLEIKRSLGEQPFKLTSIELKVEVGSTNLRESFFQCVSNSKWAHNAQLIIATTITDETIAEEFRRLGNSYDVSVISFCIPLETLDTLPDANQIMKMDAAKIESIMKAQKKIASGKERDGLDWEHLRDLRIQSRDINNLFSWIAFCLTQKKTYSVKDWAQISEIEKRVQSV